MLCYCVLGNGLGERDRRKLYKLVRRASSVLDCPLDSIQEVADRRMLVKLISIMDITSHPLHQTVESLSSSFSSTLLYPEYRKECYCKSFLPAAKRLYNYTQQCVFETMQ